MQITSVAEFDSLLAAHTHVVVLVTDCFCSTSRALVDKIEKVAEKHPQCLYVTIERKDVPKITGRLLVFVAPIVLVFVNGQEVYRADRYVRMDELERVLQNEDFFGGPYGI